MTGGLERYKKSSTWKLPFLGTQPGVTNITVGNLKNMGNIQLWPFISCNWLFLWDYTIYKWGFVSTYNWYRAITVENQSVILETPRRGENLHQVQRGHWARAGFLTMGAVATVSLER